MKRDRKYKADRSLLQNTHGSAKSPFNKRKYKPGQHKQTNLFSSFYGGLLVQRQRLKAFFKNLKGKQLITIIKKGMAKKDYKAEIIKSLESRLDSLLFRSGMAISFGAAKQLISHGKVYVNDIRVKSSSFNVSDDSVISFHESAYKLLEDNLKRCTRKSPNYISVNPQSFKIRIFASKFPRCEKSMYLSSPLSIDNVIRSYRM